MITARYVQTMARYNAWQNKGYRKAVEGMAMAELTKDRGAFFGSVFGTLNHLLWADLLWMSRFDAGDGPGVVAEDNIRLCATKGDWEALRFRTDGRINVWADRLHDVDLVGNLTWESGTARREVSKPLGLCITSFFNHQTHHRGQVHQMLTELGHKLPDTDLVLMPEES